MKSILLAALVLMAGVNRLARAAVEVTPFRVEESRTIEFANDKVSRTPPRMSILLSLHGPEAESSVRYGDLKLEDAVDDQGASLLPSKGLFNDAVKFKEYANSFFRKSNFGGNAKPADPQVELTLALPRRTAAKIARLHGSFTLSDEGTLQTVELGNLKGAGKKALAFPPGVHLGVTADVPPGEAVRSLALEITGDEAILDSLEVVDASGRKVASGTSSWSLNGGPVHKSLQLNKPLDDSMKLVAKFALNRKLTTVRFDLKDIALP
jgi:hypothetical protein